MAKQSGGSNPNTIKLIIAIVGLVFGGVLIAYNYGAFDKVVAKTPEPPNAKLPPKQVEEFQKRKKKLEQQVEKGEIEAPSGS